MKILLVFDPSRADLFSYLEKDSENEYYLLFREKRKVQISLPSFIKDEFFWSDFKTPFELIKAIRPDKIVYQEIIDIKQIALNIAARNKNIETIFLDHGLWMDFHDIRKADVEVSKKNKKQKVIKLFRPWELVKNYWFYFSVFPLLKKESFIKYFRFVFFCFKHSLVVALERVKYNERKPDKFIVFNRLNIDALSQYYGCEKNEVIYSGFPSFDAFYSERPEENNNNTYIVFIDHPYLEDKLLNWNNEFHFQVALKLSELSKSFNKKVVVKLHPRSDLKVWEGYNFDARNLKIIQRPVDSAFYLNAEIILGYSSTLLIPLISAKKNVVLVGWHPQPGIFGVDFSKTGLCHVSYSYSELKEKFSYWINHNRAKENEVLYRDFINKFNYPFDGRATERVLKAIQEG